MNKTIAVVVPTHSRMRKLIKLLRSFNELNESPEQIIIVNDGSTDKTGHILKKWEKSNHKFSATVLENACSKGPAVSRNIGINASNTDLIAFTDDDCRVDPNWVHAIKTSDYWNNKNIAGIGGRVLPVGKNHISTFYSIHKVLEPPKNLQYLVTANACYRRNLLLKINGFDKSHTYPGGEDNGLSFKLAKLGYKFEFEEKMIVKHNYRNSIKDFIKTFYRYGKGCSKVFNTYFKSRPMKN